MFNKRKDEAPPARSHTRPSVLSEGVVVTGDINVPGAIHLEGTVEGRVTADKVVVGHRGLVEGEIEAFSVSLAGQFRGSLRCNELSISHSASFHGNVDCESLKLQPGAIIEGDIAVGHNRD